MHFYLFRKHFIVFKLQEKQIQKISQRYIDGVIKKKII
ncbi:hypothetical protein P872_04070 [Rhodonellum psychrophilum GCM71 = DSM 17998]|uniref:Uncharacterized protein n=2 Tax=Rhodonellum TaxID=336827 RepID=U5C1R9_9BACT|nr:hypothetical protein P872_04070 [Rhodonellum psychrophilum GCM71 = DSM 17998]SDY97259.1 hypothetical protein SAMN05444412_104112 [Rhodonellum ikkaensis]